MPDETRPPLSEPTPDPEAPGVSLPVPPEIMAQWDDTFRALWSSSLTESLAAAEKLFAQDAAEKLTTAEEMLLRNVKNEPDPVTALRLIRDEEARLDATLEAMETGRTPQATDTVDVPDAEGRVVIEFRRLLLKNETRLPAAPVDRYHVVLTALYLVLKGIREAPAVPFVEDYLTVALRPIRKLQAGELTPVVCAALYDYQRGIWNIHLTKPQLFKIEVALSKTIAALPPDSMQAFWECLQSPDPMMQQAMQRGLRYLRSAHAVPHLLLGLEKSRDHAVKAAILNSLEEIADPRAIAPLAQMRRETARTDWTLSRHIARVIRVIELHNRGQQHRTLLRPSETPTVEPEKLLRPARPGTADDTDLLHILEDPEERA